MATAGGTLCPWCYGIIDDSAFREYYCHRCQRPVLQMPPPPSFDLVCPLCSEGFLEEEEPGRPDSGPSYVRPLAGGEVRIWLRVAVTRPRPVRTAAVAELSDRFLRREIEEWRAPAAALWDLFHAREIGEWRGPPAATSAVEALPDVEVAVAGPCPVCKGSLEVGDTAKKMPCGHVYHAGCLLHWLVYCNSCPACRYELPTDYPEYDIWRRVVRATGGRVIGVLDGDPDYDFQGGSRFRAADPAGGGGGRAGRS